MDTTLASVRRTPSLAVRTGGDARAVAGSAALLALACVIGLVESSLPPVALVPWLRLGLANVAVVIALSVYGPRVAVAVTLGRVLIVGLLTGTLGGPGSAIALAGAVAAVSLMSVLHVMSRGRLSEVGISAAGSVAHVLAQLSAGSALLGGFWLMPLAPPSVLVALLTGTLTGLLARSTVSRIRTV